MKTTKKGVSTKESIYDAARQCFFNNGYEQTTLSDICKKSKTNLGTLTYYFPKKTDIVFEIYRRYREELATFVKSFGCLPYGITYYSNFVLLYYYQIYSHPEIRRFHNEVMKNDSMDTIFAGTRSLVGPIIFNQDDPYNDLYIYGDTAIRRQFNLDFYEKGDFSFEAVKELVWSIHIVNGRLYNLSPEKLNEYLDKASKFVVENLDCDINLL